MKNLLKNAGISLFLIAFPTLLVIASAHILTAFVILATVLTVEIMVIKYYRDFWTRQTVRSRGIYSFLGIAIGLGILALNIPPRLAIIIALCIFIVGVVQLLLEEPFRGKRMLWLKIWEDQNNYESFAPINYILFLAITLFFVLMVVANFGSQMIWLPLTTCGLIVYTFVKGDLFCSSDDLMVKVVSFTALAVTGIVSTLIQFNEARVFGILIWVIGLVIGVILVLIVIFLYVRAAVQEKRRMKLEKIAEKERQEIERTSKESLQKSLTERISELNWEEIYSGFNQINEAFGIYLFLSSPFLEKLPELVTVSNEKEHFFWDDKLTHMFLIMEKINSKAWNDDIIRKVLTICDLVENTSADKKTKKNLVYGGEAALKARLEKIKEIIYTKKN